MNKCEDCNQSFEPTQKSRFKCNASLCQAWTHKQCSDKRQTSEGYWYCKTHIESIPLEKRCANLEDEELSEKEDNNENKIQDNDDNDENNSDINDGRTINSSTDKEQSTEKFHSPCNRKSVDNVSRRKKNNNAEKLIPFDNGDAYNPFANFNCGECDESFTTKLKGALCTMCRSTYHLKCLNETELEEVRNHKFICQYCILNQIRHSNLNKKNKSSKVRVNDNNNLISSTPKISLGKSEKKSRKKVKSIESDSSISAISSLSSSISSHSFTSDNDENLLQKYNKLKKLLKKRKDVKKLKRSKEQVTDSQNSDEDSKQVSHNDAMIGIYKLTQEEREKSKYDKLPIVDNVDTKWSVFFDLFKQSRKLFSDSENILRIQKSIKAKEILDIGGINLLNPRTYWQSLKLINERIAKSFNLLQRETNEIIKLKKLRNDTESKKIIEFINKIINYSYVIERYGKKKHMVDDRIISHIGNIMPYSMMNSWHKVKSRLEDNDKTVCVKHVAEFLSKQVSLINSKMHSEETDPWNENFPKPFKRNEHSTKRFYSTVASNKNVESINYCWFHKTNGHSSFQCSKLWELSGREVSDAARKNEICTFCGLKRHKDCHVGKTLNCKIENCNLKHHILFCFKRAGKNNKNFSGFKTQNDNNRNPYPTANNHNRNNRRSNRSNNRNNPRVAPQNNNNNNNNISNNNNVPPPREDQINNNNSIESEHEEILIPPSSFYLNQPPQSIRIPRNNSSNNNLNRAQTIRSEFFSNHTSLNKVTKSSAAILGVIVIKFTESNEQVAFLIDSGSTVSIIEESIANKLELKGIWCPLRINWSSDINRIDYGSRIIQVKTSAISINSIVYNMYFRTVRDLNIIDQPFDAAEMIELFPYLAPLNLTSYCRIYGIIGIDNLWCFQQIKLFKPNNWNASMPIGIRCPLGDYVIGCFNQLSDLYSHLKHNASNNNNNHQIVGFNGFVFNTEYSEEEEKELENMDKIVLGKEYNYFDCDDNDPYEDSLALEMLNKHVKRSDNKINFEAPLLWRKSDIKLPTSASFKAAYKRLLIVEKVALKNGRFGECIEHVDNLLDNDYAEIVPDDEVDTDNDKALYLATFFIQPKNKRTRFIWDAAAKVDGISLNDCLLSGPNLYNSYLKIILQMREGKYLIKGDIKEMFHQVIIRKEDRDSLRFLFRKSPKHPVQILRMRVMIFGSKSSPSTSQFVKNKVAEPFILTHPDATNVIINRTYVDDVITSVDDLQEGKSLIYDVRRILKTGGFNLVKLKSNCNDILDTVRNNLSQDDLKNEKLFSNESIEKLLGYEINFEKDEISVALSLDKIPESILNCIDKPSKKQVLQLIMSIFDPIGFTEFLISKLKLIYHWTIRENYEWNQILSDELFEYWKKCINYMKELTKIKIPRLYSNKLIDAKIKQLVGFGDAGTEMLCAVIYLRLLDENRNQIDYQFICAKSYTVPYKQSRTIPDLEVDVASKLCILMNKVQVSHNIKFDERIFFTDNSAILEWIIKGAKNPKVYVHNRLDKIKKLSNPEEWKWTPTHLQPADFGTKISAMPTLSYLNEWYKPLLFELPECNWPTIDANLNNNSVYNIHNIIENNNPDDYSFISKFSCIDRLINSVSKCLEWRQRVNIIKINREIKSINSLKSKTRSASNKKLKLLEALKEKKRDIFRCIDKLRTDYKVHEATVIRNCQQESFKTEYNDLENGKEVNNKSPIYKLLPYLDTNGVIRSQTRISNTEENIKKFGSDRINPMILHRESHLTKLIIIKEHNCMVHNNEKTVVINLLQRFYINKIRRTVNNVIRNSCLECRIANAKPVAPLMGDIPFTRLALSKNVFKYAMADLLGPLTVKISKFKTDKRYVLVYSCLTTRSLHLELIESLDSNATLRALSNTFNLRGAPTRICTDNGTNFIGGNNIMQKNHEDWNKELLKRRVISQPIEWYFSPAKAPHMNGAVERMVGLVKKAMKGIKKYLDKNPAMYDDFGLKSVLCEIINMINSRPIEILPPDEGQNTFLTPNMFLIGRQNAQSVPLTSEPPKTLTQEWKDIKIMSNIIWDQWLKCFFPIMLQREKWIDRTTPLKVGDIVITADPTITNSWRKGVITEVTMGSQGQVRQVMVRLGKNKAIKDKNSLNKNQILSAYQREVDTIVSRPATMVAKINLDNVI